MQLKNYSEKQTRRNLQQSRDGLTAFLTYAFIAVCLFGGLLLPAIGTDKETNSEKSVMNQSLSLFAGTAYAQEVDTLTVKVDTSVVSKLFKVFGCTRSCMRSRSEDFTTKDTTHVSATHGYTTVVMEDSTLKICYRYSGKGVKADSTTCTLTATVTYYLTNDGSGEVRFVTEEVIRNDRRLLVCEERQREEAVKGLLYLVMHTQ